MAAHTGRNPYGREMTAIAMILVCVSICIVDAHPLTALALGMVGYALALSQRRR